MLDAQSVSLLRGDTPCLTDISLSFKPGQLVGLIGPNGAGKSSLIKILAGVLAPSAGKAFVEGDDIHTLSPKIRAKRIAYMPQSEVSHWPISVEQAVSLGRHPHHSFIKRTTREDKAIQEWAMAATAVTHLKASKLTELSGGERARVALARTLAVGAKVILVDEPVAGLDPFHQHNILRLLSDLAQKGYLILLVIHDLTLAGHYCDQLVLLNDGRVQAQGSLSYLQSAGDLEKAFHIPWRHIEMAGDNFYVPLPVDKSKAE